MLNQITINGNKVGFIYETRDYEAFKKLNGNRSVLDRRKKLLVESIKARGWIRNPIVVNEKMEIIDGQGRFEALKELNLPVEYIFATGATIADCIALNIKQENWKNQDYVLCYAEMGSQDYITVFSLYGKYKYLNDSCINILSGNANSDGSGIMKEVREGKLNIISKESLIDRVEFANRCMEIIGSGNGRTRLWCAALKFVYFCKSIDTKLFYERLKRNRAYIVPCANNKQVLECMETVYNHGVKKNRVYFIPEWDKYLEEMRGAKSYA